MEPETTTDETTKLWTKNFTLITLGTVVSMLGNAIAGFALGLLVLDYTGSTFLYALFEVAYNLPKIVAPTFAGPFLDNFSRRRTIYTLDFISAGLYGIFAWLILSGYFNYGFLIAGCLLLGTIDSIYQVAFDSFYPMLVSKGNYSKAYSIQSTLESITMFIVPVSALLYNLIGIAPLFLINMASFLIAAIFETRIQKEETYVKDETETFGIAQYRKIFSEGVGYLKQERGLLAITLYFMVSSFAGGVFSLISLPYFKQNYTHGEYVYIFTMGWMMLGRLIGGVIHYRFKIPAEKKFAIALGVYVTISLIDGTMFYWPIVVMMALCFFDGILGVTSYNIRISATQSYVPDEKKGRFNGIFQMATTGGMLFGQFLSGVFTLAVPEKMVVSGAMALNFVAVLVIIGGGRQYVKKIYNRTV